MAAEVVETVEVEEVEVRARTKGSLTGGPTSQKVQIIPRIRSVKNITFLGKVLIGVRSQSLVLGRIILYQRISNETVASLDLKTYKKLCIHDQTQKYTLQLTV